VLAGTAAFALPPRADAEGFALLNTSIHTHTVGAMGVLGLTRGYSVRKETGHAHEHTTRTTPHTIRHDTHTHTPRQSPFVPSDVSFCIVCLRVYIAAHDVFAGATAFALLPRADAEGFAVVNTHKDTLRFTRHYRG